MTGFIKLIFMTVSGIGPPGRRPDDTLGVFRRREEILAAEITRPVPQIENNVWVLGFWGLHPIANVQTTM
jgi:hypothetical protein